MPEARNYQYSPSLEVAFATEVNLHEGQFGLKSVARRLGIGTSSGSRITFLLRQKEWVNLVADPLPPRRAGPRTQLLFTTPVFREVVRHTMEQVEVLPDEHRLLFEMGAAAFGVSETLPEGDAERRSSITYLGTAAYLGPRYDLHALTDGVWGEGESGWRSLMALRAAQLAAELGELL